MSMVWKSWKLFFENSSHKEKKLSCEAFEMVWMGLKVMERSAKSTVKGSGKPSVEQWRTAQHHRLSLSLFNIKWDRLRLLMVFLASAMQ